MAAAIRYADTERPGFEACSACALCLLPCPVWRETRDPMLTLMGRAKVLQGGEPLASLGPSLDACVLCGACEPVCPEEIDTVGMTLDLRRARAAAGATSIADAGRSLLAAWRTPEEARPAPHDRPVLLAGPALAADTRVLAAVVRHLGGADSVWVAEDDGRDAAVAVEAGLPLGPDRLPGLARTLAGASEVVVADGLLLRLLRPLLPRAVALGPALLAKRALSQALRSGDFYVIESRAYNADFERQVKRYHRLRDETGCMLSVDLHRVALPTGAASVQGRVGTGGLDVAAQVAWLLEGRHVDRVVVECLADGAAIARAARIPVVHLAEVAA